MNREVKFRALSYDTPNLAFQYGQLVYDAIDQPRIVNTDSSGKGLTFALCKKGTEGQYTGLKDKNGKEIYEGDVIEDKDGNRAVVVWIKEWGMFGSMFADEFAAYKLEGVKELDESMFWTFPIENSKVEVIGNIHENPELIA